MERPVTHDHDPLEPKPRLDLRSWLNTGLDMRINAFEQDLAMDVVSKEAENQRLNQISEFLKGQETNYNPVIFSGDLFLDTISGGPIPQSAAHQRMFYKGPEIVPIDGEKRVLLSFFKCGYTEGNIQKKIRYYANPDKESIEQLEVSLLADDIRGMGHYFSQRIDNGDFYTLDFDGQRQALQKTLQDYDKALGAPQDIYEITPTRYMSMAPGKFDFGIEHSNFDQSEYPESERISIKGRYRVCDNADYLARLQDSPGTALPFKHSADFRLSQAQPCLMFDGLEEQEGITFIVPSGSIGNIRLTQEVVS